MATILITSSILAIFISSFVLLLKISYNVVFSPFGGTRESWDLNATALQKSFVISWQ